LLSKPYSVQSRFVLVTAGATAVLLWLIALGLFFEFKVHRNLLYSAQAVDRRILLARSLHASLDGSDSAFWRAYKSGSPQDRAAFQEEAENLEALSASYASRAAMGRERQESANFLAAGREAAPLGARLLSGRRDLLSDQHDIARFEERHREAAAALGHLDDDLLEQFHRNNQALARYADFQGLALASLSVILIFSLFWFQHWQHRKLWDPLETLRLMMLQIKSGDLNVHGPALSSIELGSLMNGFHEMVGQLRGMRQSLEEKVRERTRESVAAQAGLVHASKLSAIGQLVASVAHEFNNPLTTMLGFTELLHARTDIDPSASHQIMMIHEEALRLRNLASSLVALVRRSSQRIQTMDLRSVIERLVALREYQLRVNNVRLSVYLPREPAWVEADPEQILQVLLNLVLNAEQAILSVRDRGAIRIECQAQKETVCLYVRDDGPGMSPDVQALAFDPFFTTKPPGESSGLGLSISNSIIIQCGGSLSIESAPGAGATMKMSLPLAEEPPGTIASRVPPADHGAAGVHRLVLVIDDEPHILEMVRQALESLGYAVIVSRTSVGLDELLERQEFDAVLCDLKMPGRNGIQLLRSVERIRPALAGRFIFMTGNAAEKLQVEVQDARIPVLQKPFTLSELFDAVSAIANPPRLAVKHGS
jgi:signal transduction histidine kinase/CheY-like chemotaxis protein